ncbi:hypothetical protein [Azospirillum sp. sgz301742]
MTIEFWTLLVFLCFLFGLAPAINLDRRHGSAPTHRQRHLAEVKQDEDDTVIWHSPVAGASLQSMSPGARAQYLSGLGSNKPFH